MHPTTISNRNRPNRIGHLAAALIVALTASACEIQLGGSDDATRRSRLSAQNRFTAVGRLEAK